MSNFMEIEQRNLHKYLQNKSLPKVIYVVAPTKVIFNRWCIERGIHWNNPNVVWIDRHEVVLGREINPKDEVAYVARSEFNPEELLRIDQEIKMRTRKA